ncbi:MAG: hypothetical protein HRU33_00080 [Rhodobacteraceae bacterium]|nr:hypothetical protein [Paracoccaceae bacterium]
MALLHMRKGGVSLVSFQPMLESEPYRECLFNPALKRFWLRYIAELSNREMLNRISSTMNQTGTFEFSSVLHIIVGQSKSGFSIKEVLDRKQILLVKLSNGQIGDENADFLGSLIVSMMVGQIMRRGAVRPIRTSLSLPPRTGTYAEQSRRHSARAAVRLSLKFSRE